MVREPDPSKKQKHGNVESQNPVYTSNLMHTVNMIFKPSKI